MISVSILGRAQEVEYFFRAAKAVFDLLLLEGDALVELSLVSTAKIRGLNRDFRGIDKPTDVLSFPLLELKPSLCGDYATLSTNNFPLDADENGKVNLGSIAICGSIAQKQAAQYGHSNLREEVYLFVHGLLHLLGFDHANEAQKAQMRQVEEQIMSLLSLER